MKIAMKSILLLLLLNLSLFATSQTVYITNTGEKYHSGNCRYLSKSKIEIVLKDALSQGYSACKVCKPVTQPASGSNQIEKQKNGSDSPKNSSQQCSSYTKSGARCKRTTTSSNGKCWQHGGD